MDTDVNTHIYIYIYTLGAEVVKVRLDSGLGVRTGCAAEEKEVRGQRAGRALPVDGGRPNVVVSVNDHSTVSTTQNLEYQILRRWGPPPAVNIEPR